MNAKTESNPTETCETIKLGIDAHAKWFYVGRQLDGATPQPVQKMTFEGLLRFVAKQQRLAREAHTCYEADPFGYHLHRKLTDRLLLPHIRSDRQSPPVTMPPILSVKTLLFQGDRSINALPLPVDLH